ncbi:MAG: hypothetical protein A2W86_11705 [Bacteroidetes bacterium GWD2_45_23]|nr:MAG: hypothetical protein A2W86_11705 [Bacteroidetes bacterium GWD2_45_23]HBB00710.1 hypothetical protein [Porphyromonadaceae bacterium]HCC19335.1 hypothetical protein [Porphyromonadaceae bacterium]
MQAKNSTLQATPCAATCTASTRNHSNSADNPFVQQFISLVDTVYPGLTKIRFKKTGQVYVVRVKKSRRTFSAKGYTPQNAARNFISSFNYQEFLLPV